MFSRIGRSAIAAAVMLALGAGCANYERVQLSVRLPPRQAEKNRQIRSLAILGFSYDKDPSLAIELLDRLVKAIADESPPFEIVERRQLDAIREELARQHTALFDSRLQAEVGRFLPASHVLLGTVEKFDIYDTTALEWTELTLTDPYRERYYPFSTRDYELSSVRRSARVRVAEMVVSYRVVEVESLKVLYADQVGEVYTSRSFRVALPPSRAELRRLLVERVSAQLLHNFVTHSASRTVAIRTDAALKRGNIYLAEGLLQEAAAEYQRATEEGLPAAWYNLGVAYELLGRHSEAAEAYQAALDAEPDEAAYARALVRVRQHLEPEAQSQNDAVP